MATRAKASKSKRVVRSFKKYSEDYTSVTSPETVKRRFQPEIEVSFDKFGLDSEIGLGCHDLEKLGWPKRIKVVIYNLDDQLFPSMGYTILAAQLKAINQITDNDSVESMTLLWLPGHIQLTVWDKHGNHQTHKINEDGKLLECN